MTDITKHWLLGLVKVGITAASTTVSVILAQVTVNNHIGWRIVGMSVLIASASRMAEYLRNHPLPGVDVEGEDKGDSKST